jgi:putative two-component system response regulator
MDLSTRGSRGAFPSTVLVVDDTTAIVRLFEKVLSADGFSVVTAMDGDAALEISAAVRPDVILLDVRMPRRNGFEVCRELKRHPATRLTPVVLVTGDRAEEDRLRAIEAGADDFLTKPVNHQELRARVRSLSRLKQYTDDLGSAESVILSLGQTVEVRDPYTNGHCQRLATYAVALGRTLQLGEEDLGALYRGGYLHDLGKVAVPDAILLKPSALTDEEFKVMKEHTVVGEQLCGDLKALREVKPIVRHHHERLDGSGYPDGLRGDEVPVLAQVMSVVDVYDAITTDRPYRAARSDEVAFEQLEDESRRGWKDAELVKAFLATVETPGFKSQEPPKATV